MAASSEADICRCPVFLQRGINIHHIFGTFVLVVKPNTGRGSMFVRRTAFDAVFGRFAAS
jgi:hypothetical protein